MEQADGPPITPTITKGHGDSSQNEEDVKQMLMQQQQRISVQPQTVKWLLDNYESAEGVSLPRSTLYAHYIEHCHQHGIDPVNAASFGKLIRSVFIGLRTRRLGTRGNSKYHYYGIRIKPGSSLASTLEIFGSTGGSPAQPPEKRPKLNPIGTTTSKAATTPSIYPLNNGQPTPGLPLNVTSPNDLKSYLGDPAAILPSVWPEEPTIPSNDNDSPGALLNRFAFCYRKHYEQVINAIGALQFNLAEQLWTNFWQAKPVAGEKQHLTLEQLHQLTVPSLPADEVGEEESFNSLANWIIQTDYTLYNSLISSLLLPNLLKPIPQQLALQIRNFAKNMVNWMNQSLVGYDPAFINLKCSAVSAFSHTLRRYTSLNHLSSAARAVLQNFQQVQQMINDLNKVDFRNVQEQASWACRCDDQVVKQIEQSFKSLLQEHNPSEKWPIWCDQIIDLCLQDNLEAKASTQFFFNWIFYSSLVMRDLTLRSASSFGSFHLIRLLFDEYIFYLIEHRVAKASNKTPLQVLQEVRFIHFYFLFHFNCMVDNRLMTFICFIFVFTVTVQKV
jgi:regulatory factor X 1/2/3